MRGKHRIIGHSDLYTEKVIFNHSFEEKKAIEYYHNCIHSILLYNQPYDLFNYGCCLLGSRKMISVLKRNYPPIKERIKDDLKLDMAILNAPKTVIEETLRKDITPILLRKLEALTKYSKTLMEKRLHTIKEAYRLSDLEVEVLTLCFFVGVDGIVNRFFNEIILVLSNADTFRNYLHIFLGVKRSVISEVLFQDTLFKSKIILIDGNRRYIRMSDWCLNYLSGFGRNDLSHEFFTKETDTVMSLSDFGISDDEKEVIKTLLMSNKGQNILFYGEPGTGKTSLAHCLAKTFRKELLTVKIPKDDDHEQRLGAIYATISLADGNNSVILVDEADDILNTFNSPLFKSRNDKSWINSNLEIHRKKVIWITNDISLINPSTMRRFSFSLEFKKFNMERRFNVMSKELERKGLGRYFSTAEIRELCNSYSTNASGIVNALQILNVERNTDKKQTLRMIKAVLKSHEKVITGRNAKIGQKKDFSSYSLTGLNCSEELRNIISSAKFFAERQNHSDMQFNQPFSLLLYGISGTGKSEFVYYLGHTLEKEVYLHRCSEIQSMWVGETEKNIARAFRDAQDERSILFFDEADSFLFPRKDAQRPWEKSFTNEILTQLETYTGIVAFATNNIEGLDHASLRRFRFKIEFRPLTPEGNLHFYNTLHMPLIGGECLSPEDEQILRSITDLTPGDFSVVRDRILFSGNTGITHRKMIEMLAEETRYRKGNARIIGFCS